MRRAECAAPDFAQLGAAKSTNVHVTRKRRKFADLGVWMSHTDVYEVPSAPTDPEAAALEPIVRLPAEMHSSTRSRPMACLIQSQYGAP